jgi:zinc finger SWIM domain-containing protein 3
VTIPQVGMQFDTARRCMKFWLNYGKKLGFDVRKHFINKSKKDGKVTSRGFVCAKEGVQDVGDSFCIRDQDDTRCNCHVRLYVGDSLGILN